MGTDGRWIGYVGSPLLGGPLKAFDPDLDGPRLESNSDGLRAPEPPGHNLFADIAAFQPRLVRFAYSLTRNEDDAADLAQDALVRALTAGERFRPGTNLRAWLFRILRNLHLNRLRDGANRPRLLALDDSAANRLQLNASLTPVEDEALRNAKLEEVLHAFRRLPPRYSAPVYLRSVEELTYAEIATRLGIPIGTVISRIHRGRRLLISLLVED